MATVVDATAGLDIGMLMYNAGADPNYEPFLDNAVEVALGMVQRNCIVPLQMCHHFGAAMVDRGKGGIVLVSSGAGLVGAQNMVAYAATKAFDMVMAESLWAELHDKGVDVLSLARRHGHAGVCRSPPNGRARQRGRRNPHTRRLTARKRWMTHRELENGPTWPVGEQPREARSTCA
jgi:short-subunit dehydrogenase